jgi:hypothetical protein
MSGYIGSRRSTSLVNLDYVDTAVSGLTQKNSITENIYVPSDENVVYFGDTEFTGTVNVIGSLIISHGQPDFLGDVDIDGTLYVG